MTSYITTEAEDVLSVLTRDWTAEDKLREQVGYEPAQITAALEELRELGRAESYYRTGGRWRRCAEEDDGEA